MNPDEMINDYGYGGEIGDLRQVPQNQEAEKAVLGAIFFSSRNDEAIIEANALLEPGDFYLQANQQIYSAMLALSEENRPIELVTVEDKLRSRQQLDNIGGLQYLVLLAEAQATSANLVYYAQIVREKSILRKLIDELTHTITIAYDERENSTDVVANLGRQLDKIVENKGTGDFLSIKEVLVDVQQKIDEASRQDNVDDITGLTTGLIDYDKITRGFKGGQMVVIGARPGMGKTAFALELLRGASRLNKVPSVIFSMEMDASSLVMRLLAAQGEIDAKKLESGQLSPIEQNKLYQAINDLSSMKIFISESTDVKVNNMRAQLRKLERELLQKMTEAEKRQNPHPIGMVMVDYLQLMDSDNREGRQQAVSENSRKLKKLAMELDTTILALSQLNRSLEQRTNKRPNLSDIRESGSIEQDADIVTFLHREDYFNDNEEDGEQQMAESTQSEMELIVAKNRAGERGSVNVMFRKNIYKFDTETPRQEIPANGYPNDYSMPQPPQNEW